MAEWRTQRRSFEDQLKALTRTGNAAPGCPPDREAARVAAELAELADLRCSFALADPRALRAALATVIEGITLDWTDGGPRKWPFQHGTIRLGGSLRLLASSTLGTWHFRLIPLPSTVACLRYANVSVALK